MESPFATGAMMEHSMHDIRFPGESDEYRAARNRLLEAEADLRKQTEQVAALRRSLPDGGLLKEDYLFDEAGPGAAGRVKLSELFRGGKDTLILYSFMYGPDMQQACPSCTSILDGLNGVMPHALQRTNIAVVARSPVERISSFARERGWSGLRLLSSANNSYNADYHGETAEGKQRPALNVFMRRDGAIRHFYCTELLFVTPEPGQDARHVDTIWPLWNLFDLMPEGRGIDWRPALAYGAS
jgi:predicted dithiol-disulfide oxidoreductase (DUF899 family)